MPQVKLVSWEIQVSQLSNYQKSKQVNLENKTYNRFKMIWAKRTLSVNNYLNTRKSLIIREARRTFMVTLLLTVDKVVNNNKLINSNHIITLSGAITLLQVLLTDLKIVNTNSMMYLTRTVWRVVKTSQKFTWLTLQALETYLKLCRVIHLNIKED